MIPRPATRIQPDRNSGRDGDSCRRCRGGDAWPLPAPAANASSRAMPSASQALVALCLRAGRTERARYRPEPQSRRLPLQPHRARRTGCRSRDGELRPRKWSVESRCAADARRPARRRRDAISGQAAAAVLFLRRTDRVPARAGPARCRAAAIDSMAQPNGEVVVSSVDDAVPLIAAAPARARLHPARSPDRPGRAGPRAARADAHRGDARSTAFGQLRERTLAGWLAQKLLAETRLANPFPDDRAQNDGTAPFRRPRLALGSQGAGDRGARRSGASTCACYGRRIAGHAAGAAERLRRRGPAAMSATAIRTDSAKYVHCSTASA